MNIEAVKLVYFSPTGTTKRIVEAVADGLAAGATRVIDITRPAAREQPLSVAGDELLVVAVPVYMGRVPGLLQDWLRTIQARATPTVCVVVYGNRAYEDALLELNTIVASRGCVPVAGAAYIGEHSFSNAATPVAQGRPDAADLDHARSFGRKIGEKLRSLAAISEACAVRVPGEYPYRKDTKLWDVDFITVNEDCAHCGLCAEICPVGAIAAHDGSIIDVEKCITCCACIKQCPRQARTMKPSPVQEAAKRLHSMCAEPKQPECFL